MLRREHGVEALVRLVGWRRSPRCGDHLRYQRRPPRDYSRCEDGHPGRHQIRRRGRAERGRDSGTSATLVSLYHGAALVEVAEDDPPGSALDNLMTVPSEELDLRWSHRTGWVDDGSLMEASFATIGRSTIYSFTVNFTFTGEIGI